MTVPDETRPDDDNSAASSEPLDWPTRDQRQTDEALDQTGSLHATRSFAIDDSVETKTAATDKIGPYQLVRCLGEGGMGSVWEALQTAPIKRHVALKVIKGGIHSPQVIARFESERQALALMDHPHIARIYDGGISDAGQPYFAMERVDGMPLTEYCNAIAATIEQRLKLFCQICAAVQHAHQKGIIHRDLKPGNILVTTVDGQPVPKVIDFGLAKAMEGAKRLSDDSMHTQIGQVLGTVKYMSPEQAALDSTDVDTRSDLYSLGVILYELLIGQTPLDDATLRSQPFLKVLERIRSQEIEPATRLFLRKNATEQLAICEARKTDSQRLVKSISGDLDCILLKSVSRELDNRYQSAAEFAADIARFLNHEPVAAQPPSRGYLLKKFLRKNRLPVTIAAAVMVLVVAGLIGTSWGFWQATQARLQAEKSLAQVERNNSILTGIFRDLDIRQVKSENKPLERVMADRLVEAGKLLDLEDFGRPLQVAATKAQLGESLINLGFADDAVPLLESAVKIRSESLGDSDESTLDSRNLLAEGWLELGHHDQAASEFQTILDIRKKYSLKKDIGQMRSMNNLAESYRRSGRLDEAIELFKTTYVDRRELLGESDVETIITLNNLGLSYLDALDYGRSIERLEAALAACRQGLEDEHPTTLAVMNNLTSAYWAIGRQDEAVSLAETAHRLVEVRMGADHPDSLTLASNLADLLFGVGNMDESLTLYQKTLSRMEKRLGIGHLSTLTTMLKYGEALCAAEQYQESISVLEKTLDLMESHGHKAHDYFDRTLQGLGSSFWLNGDTKRSLETYEAVLESQQSKLGNDHPDTLFSQINIAVMLRETGGVDRAIELLEDVLPYLEKYPDLKNARRELRTAYGMNGRTAEFMKLIDSDLIEVREQNQPGSLELAAVFVELGADLLVAEEFDKAEQILRESCLIRSEKLGDDWRVHNTWSMLGEALLGQLMVAAKQGPVDGANSSDSNLLNELKQETLETLERSAKDLIRLAETIPPIARKLRVREAIDRLIQFHDHCKNSDQMEQWQIERVNWTE